MRECISIHVGQAGVQIGKLADGRERGDWRSLGIGGRGYKIVFM